MVNCGLPCDLRSEGPGFNPYPCNYFRFKKICVSLSYWAWTELRLQLDWWGSVKYQKGWMMRRGFTAAASIWSGSGVMMVKLVTSWRLRCRAKDIRSWILFMAATTSRDARINVTNLTRVIVNHDVVIREGNSVWKRKGHYCDRLPMIVLVLNAILNFI